VREISGITPLLSETYSSDECFGSDLSSPLSMNLTRTHPTEDIGILSHSSTICTRVQSSCFSTLLANRTAPKARPLYLELNLSKLTSVMDTDLLPQVIKTQGA
jgi:hypothetical protein